MDPIKYYHFNFNIWLTYFWYHFDILCSIQFGVPLGAQFGIVLMLVVPVEASVEQLVCTKC